MLCRPVSRLSPAKNLRDSCVMLAADGGLRSSRGGLGRAACSSDRRPSWLGACPGGSRRDRPAWRRLWCSQPSSRLCQRLLFSSRADSGRCAELPLSAACMAVSWGSCESSSPLPQAHSAITYGSAANTNRLQRVIKILSKYEGSMAHWRSAVNRRWRPTLH